MRSPMHGEHRCTGPSLVHRGQHQVYVVSTERSDAYLPAPSEEHLSRSVGCFPNVHVICVLDCDTWRLEFEPARLILKPLVAGPFRRSIRRPSTTGCTLLPSILQSISGHQSVAVTGWIDRGTGKRKDSRTRL